MNIAKAYTSWSTSYDTDRNLTRDLDFEVTRKLIQPNHIPVMVEAGCGTGKNTVYFSQIAGHVYALDFSAGMLEVARRNLSAENVYFQQADLTLDWPCPAGCADLVSFNLVLEHIHDVAAVIRQATQILTPTGRLFISELHPFRQYQHSQARFLNEHGEEVKIPAFTHNISDYVGAAEACGLQLVHIGEWWHTEDSTQGVPRLVTFIFQRPFVA